MIKNRINEIKNKINLENIFNYKTINDIIVCFCIILLSLKRGGFYTEDILFYVIVTCIIGISYIIIDILNRFKKDIKFNSPTIIYFLFILAIAYILPIVFKTYINYDDALFEFFRYLSLFFTCYIIYKSNNKKIYIYTLILLGLLQCIFGIDSMSIRIFEDFINSIGSSYLSVNRDRLSGTIQYANTTGILILISYFLLLDILKNNLIKDNKIVNMLNSILTIFTTCILLTESRMVMILYFVSLAIYVFKSKEKKIKLIFMILINIILANLAYINISNLVLSDSNQIYFVTLCYCILAYILTKYIMKFKLLNKEIYISINNKRIVYISFIVVFVIYIIIGLNSYTSLNIKSNSKNIDITRQIYNLNLNEVNELYMEIEDLNDSEYFIEIYKEDKEYNLNEIQTITNQDVLDNKINLQIDIDENIKRLVLIFKIEKGEININKTKINNNLVPLQYNLLPSDIIFRFKDVLNGSTTNKDRFEYFKDGIKIWKISPIIGNGGEAFRHLYKEVQTYKYISNEAHNSFLQILLESGIVGFINIVIVIVLTLKNSKYSIYKLMLMIYIFHSFFDLNFSFFISIIIFGILINLNLENKIKE